MLKKRLSDSYLLWLILISCQRLSFKLCFAAYPNSTFQLHHTTEDPPLDFDYENNDEREIVDDVTDEVSGLLKQQGGGGGGGPSIPGINSFLTNLLPSTLPPPTIDPAALCAIRYALCFTVLYGARKCCIGIVCPPFGVVCDPNEKKKEGKIIDKERPYKELLYDTYWPKWDL